MKEKGQECPKSSINHTQISDTIVSKVLGDVFTISLPENVEFTEEDFTRINFLFCQTIAKPGMKSNLFTNPDFLLCMSEQNVLTVYKDTSWNLGLFKRISEQIQQMLDKYPQAYPLIMNRLVAKIPETQRDEIGYMPIGVTDQLAITTLVDDVPPNVLKALIRLTNDPNKKHSH